MFQLQSFDELRKIFGLGMTFSSLTNPILLLPTITISTIDKEFRKGTEEAINTMVSGIDGFFNTIKSCFEQIKKAFPQIETNLFWVIIAIIILITLLR